VGETFVTVSQTAPVLRGVIELSEAVWNHPRQNQQISLQSVTGQLTIPHFRIATQ
jgi:hypothetical protein